MHARVNRGTLCYSKYYTFHGGSFQHAVPTHGSTIVGGSAIAAALQCRCRGTEVSQQKDRGRNTNTQWREDDEHDAEPAKGGFTARVMLSRRG